MFLTSFKMKYYLWQLNYPPRQDAYLVRKSSRARAMPSARSILGVQPNALNFAESITFRGVPSGLLISHSISPLKPITFFTISASSPLPVGR